MAGLCLTLSAYARTTRRVRATRLRERRLSLPAGRRRGGGEGADAVQVVEVGRGRLCTEAVPDTWMGGL